MNGSQGIRLEGGMIKNCSQLLSFLQSDEMEYTIISFKFHNFGEKEN